MISARLSGGTSCNALSPSTSISRSTAEVTTKIRDRVAVRGGTSRSKLRGHATRTCANQGMAPRDRRYPTWLAGFVIGPPSSKGPSCHPVDLA